MPACRKDRKHNDRPPPRLARPGSRAASDLDNANIHRAVGFVPAVYRGIAPATATCSANVTSVTTTGCFGLLGQSVSVFQDVQERRDATLQKMPEDCDAQRPRGLPESLRCRLECQSALDEDMPVHPVRIDKTLVGRCLQLCAFPVVCLLGEGSALVESGIIEQDDASQKYLSQREIDLGHRRTSIR